ncbi:hypothetical protein GGS20DRAFT_540516 [Poronia punctata]|nr:hypothetical protein GGS20DRAFT_540516 [Poronia punctata]
MQKRGGKGSLASLLVVAFSSSVVFFPISHLPFIERGDGIDVAWYGMVGVLRMFVRLQVEHTLHTCLLWPCY